MLRTIIYGGGDGCRRLVSCDSLLINRQLLCVLDSNPELNGKAISYEDGLKKILIHEVSYCRDIVFDEIIVTVRNASIANVVRTLNIMGISEEKICVFNNATDGIIPFSIYNRDLPFIILRNIFNERIIQFGMLTEYLNNGEFEKCEKIGIIGYETEYEVAKLFFNHALPNCDIIHYDCVDECINCDKYIFVSNDYNIELLKVKILEFGSKLLIVPLYDVGKYIV